MAAESCEHRKLSSHKSPPPSQPNNIERRHSSTLLKLPNELLHQILDYVPRPTQRSIQHVCRELHQRSPALPPLMSNPMSPCERASTLRTNEANALLRTNQRRCITCGQPRPCSKFRRPETPICTWHDGWFTKRSIPSATLETALHQKLLGLPPTLNAWVSFPRTYCAHSKEVVNWSVRGDCGCEGGQCRGGVCGHFDVMCYVRIAQTDGKGLELEFVEDGHAGVVGVVETRRQEGPYGRKVEERRPVVALSRL